MAYPRKFVEYPGISKKKEKKEKKQTQPISSKTTLGFFGCPGEIRDMIYDLLLPSDMLGPFTSMDTMIAQDDFKIMWFLSLTCRTVRGDVLSLCYRKFAWEAIVEIRGPKLSDVSIHNHEFSWFSDTGSWRPRAGDVMHVVLHSEFLPSFVGNWQTTHILDLLKDEPYFGISVYSEISSSMHGWRSMRHGISSHTEIEEVEQAMTLALRSKLQDLISSKGRDNRTRFSRRDWYDVIQAGKMAAHVWTRQQLAAEIIARGEEKGEDESEDRDDFVESDEDEKDKA